MSPRESLTTSVNFVGIPGKPHNGQPGRLEEPISLDEPGALLIALAERKLYPKHTSRVANMRDATHRLVVFDLPRVVQLEDVDKNATNVTPDQLIAMMNVLYASDNRHPLTSLIHRRRDQIESAASMKAQAHDAYGKVFDLPQLKVSRMLNESEYGEPDFRAMLLQIIGSFNIKLQRPMGEPGSSTLEELLIDCVPQPLLNRSRNKFSGYLPYGIFELSALIHEARKKGQIVLQPSVLREQAYLQIAQVLLRQAFHDQNISSKMAVINNLTGVTVHGDPRDHYRASAAEHDEKKRIFVMPASTKDEIREMLCGPKGWNLVRGRETFIRHVFRIVRYAADLLDIERAQRKKIAAALDGFLDGDGFDALSDQGTEMLAEFLANGVIASLAQQLKAAGIVYSVPEGEVEPSSGGGGVGGGGGGSAADIENGHDVDALPHRGNDDETPQAVAAGGRNM